jgi:hypothetical protein
MKSTDVVYVAGSVSGSTSYEESLPSGTNSRTVSGIRSNKKRHQVSVRDVQPKARKELIENSCRCEDVTEKKRPLQAIREAFDDFETPSLSLHWSWHRAMSGQVLVHAPDKNIDGE